MKNLSYVFVLIFSIQITATEKDLGVPGPRDCFWSLGPHSGDPYINLAY